MKHYINVNYLKISVFCPLLFFICSCGGIDDNSSSEKRELKSDKKKLEEIISPNFITRVDNKLVFASSSSTRKMLHVYSLPDLEYLNSTGEKGKGPEEIQLFPMFCESLNPSLYVWGYGPTTIKKFDISQTGELKLNDIIKLPRYESFNYMHILNDSLFIYYLPDNLKVVKVDLKNNKYLDDIQMKIDDHSESWFYSNRGTIAANDSFVVFGYLFKKQINIYRVNDFKLHKNITGNYKHKDPIVGDFETPMYYTQIVAGKNFIYALCNDNENNNVVMEVYNYEGLFVKEFTFDITPELFSVDEDNNMIYGFAYDDTYEPYLLKFNF